MVKVVYALGNESSNISVWSGILVPFIKGKSVPVVLIMSVIPVMFHFDFAFVT